MQNCFGLLIADMMPLYMIMPRYSHNYALFYQLLDNNLFTHGSTYAILREATSETYGPRVYLLSYKFPINFYLLSLLFSLYHKNAKNIILSSLSDLTLVSDREGIGNPFIALVARFLFVCVGAWDSSVISYWIDTLVLKNRGKYLRYFTAPPFPVQGKTNTMLKR